MATWCTGCCSNSWHFSILKAVQTICNTSIIKYPWPIRIEELHQKNRFSSLCWWDHPRSIARAVSSRCFVKTKKNRSVAKHMWLSNFPIHDAKRQESSSKTLPLPTNIKRNSVSTSTSSTTAPTDLVQRLRSKIKRSWQVKPLDDWPWYNVWWCPWQLPSWHSFLVDV